MDWLLILTVLGAQGVSTTTAPFRDEGACRSAAAAFREQFLAQPAQGTVYMARPVEPGAFYNIGRDVVWVCVATSSSATTAK